MSKSIPRQEERSLSIWKGVEFLHQEEIEPYRVNERLIGTSSNSNVLLLLLSGRITSFVRTSLSSFIFGSWGWVDGGRRSRFLLGSLGNIRTRQESRSKRIKIYFAQTDRSAAASLPHLIAIPACLMQDLTSEMQLSTDQSYRDIFGACHRKKKGKKPSVWNKKTIEKCKKRMD